MTKEAILKKFFTDNPNFPKGNVYVYPYTKDDEIKDFFVLLCNEPSSSGTLSSAELKKFLAYAGESNQNALNIFCEMFQKKSDAIEQITDLIIKTNKSDFSASEIVEHFSKDKSMEKTVSEGLLNANTITAHKIMKDGSLSEDISFKLDCEIEEIKTQKQTKKRCLINEAESFEKGKGLYRESLKFLSTLCEKEQVSGMVLQASAFNVESENTTQEKLENFYKNNGFVKVAENEISDYNLVRPSDFNDELPIYFKNVGMEFGHELF